MRKAASQTMAGRLPGRFRSQGGLALLGVLVLAGFAGGCQTDGSPTAAFASVRPGTIAFESIDGPPQPVFQKLVENLAAEAVARQVSVISRESTPSYRVRGYTAAHIENKRVHIGWVWDVYDASKRRVLRITDEEVGSGNAATAWNAADDAVLRRIARTGMDRIATFLGNPGTGAAPAEAPTGQDGTRVAEAPDDTSPSQPPAEAATPAAPARTLARRQQHAAAPALAAALALADTRH